VGRGFFFHRAVEKKRKKKARTEMGRPITPENGPAVIPRNRGKGGGAGSPSTTIPSNGGDIVVDWQARGSKMGWRKGRGKGMGELVQNAKNQGRSVKKKP